MGKTQDVLGQVERKIFRTAERLYDQRYKKLVDEIIIRSYSGTTSTDIKVTVDSRLEIGKKDGNLYMEIIVDGDPRIALAVRGNLRDGTQLGRANYVRDVFKLDIPAGAKINIIGRNILLPMRRQALQEIDRVLSG